MSQIVKGRKSVRKWDAIGSAKWVEFKKKKYREI